MHPIKPNGTKTSLAQANADSPHVGIVGSDRGAYKWWKKFGALGLVISFAADVGGVWSWVAERFESEPLPWVPAIEGETLIWVAEFAEAEPSVGVREEIAETLDHEIKQVGLDRQDVRLKLLTEIVDTDDLPNKITFLA